MGRYPPGSWRSGLLGLAGNWGATEQVSLELGRNFCRFVKTETFRGTTLGSMNFQPVTGRALMAPAWFLKGCGGPRFSRVGGCIQGFRGPCRRAGAPREPQSKPGLLGSLLLALWLPRPAQVLSLGSVHGRAVPKPEGSGEPWIADVKLTRIPSVSGCLVCGEHHSP